MNPATLALLAALTILCSTGCSARRYAINKLGDALSGSGTAFASDNDPQLIRDAVPFSLKLMESLLAESPRHRGLLLATSSGFTQYTYAFVQQDADQLEATDLAASNESRARARRLYLRARDYGLRGLEVRHRNFTRALRDNPREAVKTVAKAEVALLYWTAAAWGAAISVSKDQPELIADQPIVEALIDQAYQLDPDFDHGAIHGFLIAYQPARPGISKDEAARRAREHFDRAVALTDGQAAAPFVSYAESICIRQQDRAQFESLLQRALAIDVNHRPEWRLRNIITQQRARWLLSRVDDLFIQ